MVGKKKDDKLARVLKGLTGITESEQPSSLQEQISNQQVLMTKLYDPPYKDKGIGEIYRNLLEIRDGWRNVIEHGFRSKEELLLIPLPKIGLVPISYTSASKAIHFAITPSPKDGIQEALDIFSAFDTWAVNNQKVACVILFAQYGNPIPLMEQRLEEIRKWMSSPETLKSALEAEEGELQSWLDQYQ